MRVFMLGWEFPPLISGGLGTACYCLTKAMDQLDVEVTGNAQVSGVLCKEGLTSRVMWVVTYGAVLLDKGSVYGLVRMILGREVLVTGQA